MPFTKIEAKDYDGKGVTGLPDIPRLDTLDMQKKFDELAKDVAIPKHNVLVDELSGETAADNLGIADDIADFSNPTKKIKPLLVAFAKKIKENSNDRHTHKNKTVLDNIADTAITAWNKVSNLFTNIDGVEDVVSGRTSKIPSSFAISQYVQQMGGGDMVKSIYDRNGNGIVDDAEALGGKAAGEYQTAESQELQTTSKTVVGAVNEVFNKTKDVLNTKEEIEANTDPTAIAGALSVKELSNDLKANGSQFHFDYHNGQWGFNTDPARGADTFVPFRKSIKSIPVSFRDIISAGKSKTYQIDQKAHLIIAQLSTGVAAGTENTNNWISWSDGEYGETFTLSRSDDVTILSGEKQISITAKNVNVSILKLYYM